MEDLLLGIDLGTTSTKTALFTVDGSKTLAEAYVPMSLQWHGPGVVEQDPTHFYAAAMGTISECLERVGGVGERVVRSTTGQMVGDGHRRTWAPSMPYDSWLDTRCAADVAFLTRELGDDLIEQTGCSPMVNHAPKFFWWRREHPEVFARTAKFVMPSGYVAGRMAGLRAVDAFIDHIPPLHGHCRRAARRLVLHADEGAWPAYR